MPFGLVYLLVRIREYLFDGEGCGCAILCIVTLAAGLLGAILRV
jgi:hypothetical protein